MYCAKCGARLAEGAKKCDKCGEAVRVRPAAASEKHIDKAFDYAPGNLNKKDNHKGKSGDSFSADQKVQDPAFCEEPGENVDVQSIIRIAHGEEPAAKKTGSGPKDGKKPVDSDGGGRLRYGAVTPLEKLRRRITEMRHQLEESAEEKRMNRHMERAAKHYEELGAPATPILKSAERKTKTGGARKHASDSVIPAREGRKPASGQAGSGHRAKKPAAGQTSLEPEAIKAESIDDQVAREREEKVRAQQDKQAHKAGRQAEPERADSTVSPAGLMAAAEEKIPAGQKDAAEYDESAERAAVEVQTSEKEAVTGDGTLEKETATQVGALEKEASAEGGALEKEAAAEVGILEKEAAEEGETLEKEAAAEGGTADTEAAGRKAVEEKILAEQKAREEQKALEERERRERERRARETAARRERTLSAEEKQLREARRIRRYYEEEPDAMDLFLDKFGLTKETGVKIATLFLVVVLSLVYVIGRSRSAETGSSSPSGQGAPGETFSVSPESEETEDSDVLDDSDLPTGGGDFENSQSDTDAQQEGPDTQEPTENEAP